MKVLVFSDSHGRYSKMSQIFDSVHCDAVIFLGDGLSEAQRLYESSGARPVYRVCGNCDFAAFSVPDIQLLELSGKRVLITHGHRQNVKQSMDQLYTLGAQNNADIVLFGHTHAQFFEQSGDIAIANPGSVAEGKYAVMTITDKIQFEFGDVYD